MAESIVRPCVIRYNDEDSDHSPCNQVTWIMHPIYQVPGGSPMGILMMKQCFAGEIRFDLNKFMNYKPERVEFNVCCHHGLKPNYGVVNLESSLPPATDPTNPKCISDELVNFIVYFCFFSLGIVAVVIWYIKVIFNHKVMMVTL